MRWGVESLFSPEALTPPHLPAAVPAAAGDPAADTAPDAAAATLKAEDGGAVTLDTGAAQNGGAAAPPAAGSPAAANAAAAVADEAPVLPEPALQWLAGIADEIRKSPDWTPAALAAAAPDAAAAASAPGAPTANGPAGGTADAAGAAAGAGGAAAAAGGAFAPKVVTGLGPGLEGVVTREWQPNECKEDEVSEAGALSCAGFNKHTARCGNTDWAAAAENQRCTKHLGLLSCWGYTESGRLCSCPRPRLHHSSRNSMDSAGLAQQRCQLPLPKANRLHRRLELLLSTRND